MRLSPNCKILILLSVPLIVFVVILYKYSSQGSFLGQYSFSKTFPIVNFVQSKQVEIDTTTKNSEIPTKYIVNLTDIKDVSIAEKIYYETITKNTINCTKSVRVGRADDGGWDVCMLPEYELKSGKCISYSFGVNYIWEFDDMVASKYGCTVRTFDPSMNNEPDQLQRPSKVWFYKIGIGKEDTKWSNGWNIMKMSSILKKFNELNKTIDILKVDVEFSEWDSFEMMVNEGIFKNVKQLLFETHTEEVQSRMTSLESFKRFLKVWMDIYGLGFRQWKNHWNHFGNYQSKRTSVARTCCFEHYLINTNFLSNRSK